MAKSDAIDPSGIGEKDVWVGQGDMPTDVGWSSEWVGKLDEVRDPPKGALQGPEASPAILDHAPAKAMKSSRKVGEPGPAR